MGGAAATLLFFWDYDTQWGADRSRSPGGAKDWGRLEFENTELLLDLHARYGVPACFAVVGAAALPGERPYHDPAQIRRIHSAGHEVASHAFRHEWLPGLNRQDLLKTLRRSKDALEQCVGAPVRSFIPPYNQPFDYIGRGSVSLSERRECGRERTDLRRLCDALGETGYHFCRVSYRPLHQRVAERLAGRRLDRPSRREKIADITCVRLNTPGGFDAPAVGMLDRCAEAGGLAVVYGHPHSLLSGGAQDKSHLIPFLERVGQLRRQGRLEVRLPSEVVRGEPGSPETRK
jgi:peptidoglycan/xylan/chitin deacetylase (PgdA/CDA1 family)